MTAKSFGVEMDFVVTVHDVNLGILQAELQLRVQRYVLPLLVGCDIEIFVYIVHNAVLTSVSVGNPVICNDVSEWLCSSVHLELDLFSKDDDVLSEVLLDLTTSVFQDEGLLTRVNLASPVEGIDFHSI